MLEYVFIFLGKISHIQYMEVKNKRVLKMVPLLDMLNKKMDHGSGDFLKNKQEKEFLQDL